MSEYTVEETPRGVIVRGIVPVSDLTALSRTWERKGWSMVDARIANHLGVLMVVTSPEESKAWRVELGIYKLSKHEHTWARKDNQPGTPTVCLICGAHYN